jgi:hypothetical protein
LSVRDRPRGPSAAARGQVDPLPALLAVVVVGLSLSLYTGALDALPASDDGADDRADVALTAVCDAVCPGGVVDPQRLDAAGAASPDRHRLHVRVVTSDDTWTSGPTPPADAGRATRPVSVRLDSGRVVAGRLVVEVWPR